MDAPTTSKGDTLSILLDDSFLDVDLIEVDDLINSATTLLGEIYSTRPMPAPSASSEFLNSIREPEVNEEDDVVFVAARPGNALRSNARTTAVLDLCTPTASDEGTPNSSPTRTSRGRDITITQRVRDTRPMAAPSTSSEREDSMQKLQRFFNSICPRNALPSNARTTAVLDLCTPTTADEGTSNSSLTRTSRRCRTCNILSFAFPQLTDSNIPVNTHRRQPKKESNTDGKTTKVRTPPTSSTTAAHTTGSLPQSGRLPSLMCAVCMESVISRQPSSTSCGHIFCEKCIMQAIELTKKCPLCNCKLTRTQVHRVYF